MSDHGGEDANERVPRRLAWFAFVLWLLFLMTSFAFHLATKPVAGKLAGDGGDALFILLTGAFPVVAILILARQPRNRIGWILMAIGLGWVLPFGDYGSFALSRDLPGGAVFVALSSPIWAPPIGLMGTSLLLRFPTGRLLSPRWRKVEWLAVVSITVAVLAIILSPGDLTDSGYPNLANPLGIESLKPLLNVALVFIFLIPITIVASAVSLVMRFRRSTGVERLQLKWLTSAAAIVAVTYLITMIASINSAWNDSATDPTWLKVLQNGVVLAFALIPIAIGFAVLKYRLYDIDVVINKTLVYAALAAFITAVYVGIVVGIGHAVGRERNLGLSILATALVAVGFQPVRERVQRFANRLVYGKRATPYEVLSEFSGGMAQAVATDELLPRMARMVADGTGAAHVDVWLRVGSELVREVSWPEGDGVSQAIPPVVEEPQVTVEGPERAVAVRHQGELLGVINVTKAQGDAITSAEAKLLEDLASQAGLVLRNVRLIEELRTSRQRLVTAQDEERRRLERNLHDGAQQRLVSISLALRLAKAVVAPDADPQLGSRLDQASEQLMLALQELRELARGIHPAILTERGLGPALTSLAERSTIPASVESTVDGRLPASVEATAYFVVSEALANVGKYSKASAVTIRAGISDGELSIEVLDDGVGGADAAGGSGLRGLADRVAAVDGRLEIDSPPGRGTRLSCWIPVKGFPAPAEAQDEAPAMADAAGR
jgi:signal transduction histidine kinase